MRTKKVDRVLYSINVPKVLSKKKEYIKRRRERIYIAQYHYKIIADIA